MSSKRNHHKQPNFYLKGFKSSDEGKEKVWVYEKGKPFYDGKTEQLQNPRHLTTEKAARTRDFYAFDKEDGTKEYDKYEDLLEQQFERPAIDVIEKIKRFEEIDENEMQIFLRYVASMIMRGDWWKNKKIELNEKFECKIQQYVETLSNVDEGKTWLEMAARATKARESGEFGLESIPEGVDNFQKSYFPKLKWRGFLFTKKKIHFPTSDHPVTYTSFHNENPSLFFPVSSEVCFFATSLERALQVIFSIKNDSLETSTLDLSRWKSNDKGFWIIDTKSAETIRKIIVCNSLNEVYYSQKAEWLVRFINNRTNK